jgi:hypothetical protein
MVPVVTCAIEVADTSKADNQMVKFFTIRIIASFRNANMQLKWCFQRLQSDLMLK